METTTPPTAADPTDALTELLEGAYAKAVQRADIDGWFDARDSARAMLDGIEADEPTLPYEVGSVLGASLVRNETCDAERPVVTNGDVCWLAKQIIEANLCATDGQDIGEPFAEALADAMFAELDTDVVIAVKAARA